MAGTGFSFSSTPSSASSPFSFSSSPASTPSSFFSSASALSSSPFAFSISNPTSTSTSAPSSSPSFGFGGFGASTTSSSASPAPPFGFASSTAMASSASSPLFGSSSGSGFTPSIFGSASSSSSSVVSSGNVGSASSASTASSAGSPLFGAASFSSGSATTSPFRASTLFGSSASSSASGSTSVLGQGSGSGSSGSLFGSSAASIPFGSSASSPASGFSATTSASSSPFSSGLFGSSSSALGVSSSVSTATAPSFSLLGSSVNSGLGTVTSTPAFLFNSGTSSVSSAPSFASPITSVASSSATVSGLSFPSTTPASSASSGEALSFPMASPTSSASSAPGFSFSLSSGSSAASSSPFLASSAPAFSFSKVTGISAATAVSASTAPSLSSLSSSSSIAGFSLGTSGFQTSASAPAFSASPASKPSFGTTTSPLFSTVTTTTSASIPAATIATSASGSSTGLALNIPAFSPAASSAAASSGFSITTSSGTMTATTSSFSLSTKLPAAGSSTQPQSIAAAPLSGALVSLAGKSSGSAFCLRIDVGDEDEKVQGEGEQVSECVLEQPVVEMNSYETNHSELSVLGQDQGWESDSMKDGGGVRQDSEPYSVACVTTIYPKEPEAILADDWGKQPIKDVAESPQKISENHDEFSAVGQDQGGISYPVQDVGIVEQDYESLAFACSTTIHDEQLEAIPAVVPAKTLSLSNSGADFASVIGDTPKMQPAAVYMGKQQPIKDVIGGQEETSATSSVVSEAIGDEVGLSAMGQAFSAFSHSGLTNLKISSSDTQMIIRSIFDKHGDITRGSVVKSLVMRSTLLQAVTEVVHRLCNHTMNSLGFDELQLMQSLADDAAAVGFSVDWLRGRLKKVSAASKYHERRVHLESLGEQINAAKKSLMEMELQQLVWKKEVDCLKVELEGIDFEGTNLGIPVLASTTAATSSASSAAQTLSLVVASSSGTTSSTTTAVVSTPKLPSEVTGKTVEEIIKEWNTELQERARKFQKQANAIAEWDKRILQNRDILLRLETDVAKVVETQANLERQLELIETHQDEVDKALQSMEEEAERIYKDERGLLLDDEAASTRDAMYEQAEFIEREMEHMTEQIKAIINALNTSQGGELEATDGMTPLDVVVRILNNQLSSLVWIDEKAEEFSSRIQKLASQGSVVDREIMSPKFWPT